MTIALYGGEERLGGDDFVESYSGWMMVSWEYCHYLIGPVASGVALNSLISSRLYRYDYRNLNMLRLTASASDYAVARVLREDLVISVAQQSSTRILVRLCQPQEKNVLESSVGPKECSSRTWTVNDF